MIFNLLGTNIMNIKAFITILILGFSGCLAASTCSGTKVALCSAQNINNCSNYYQNVSGKYYQCALTKIKNVTSCYADGNKECSQ
jgi:hypothetical protein